MSGAGQEWREKGLEYCLLMGKIVSCEEPLGGPATDDAKLLGLSQAELKSLSASLQQPLRDPKA